MDLYELSEYYWSRSREADKVGLEQKAKEYKAIWSALDRADSYEKFAKPHLHLDEIVKLRPRYKNPFESWPTFVWYADETWIKSFWLYLTDKWNWERNTYPGFLSFFEYFWEDVKIFFLWTLSPWFHIRYWFTCCFANRNDGKLLDDGIGWACLRNRQEDQVYYELKFCGFHYTLKKWRWMKDGETMGRNGFMAGLLLAFDSEKSDEEKTEEAESIKKVEEKVCSGWVFGWHSFIKQFYKIVELTPDLDWTKSLTY